MKVINLFLLFIVSINLGAWWDTGHKMVCDEAYKLLSTDALEQVDPLIKKHGSFG